MLLEMSVLGNASEFEIGDGVKKTLWEIELH